MTRLLRAGIAGLTALGTVAAFAPAFGAPPGRVYLLPTVGAVGVLTALGLVLGLTRLDRVTRLAAEVVALAGYLTVVFGPGQLRALPSGPRRLVTAALPLDPGGVELASVALLAGLVAIGAIEPALRAAARSTQPEPRAAARSTQPEPRAAARSTQPEPRAAARSTQPEPRGAARSTRPALRAAARSTEPELGAGGHARPGPRPVNPALPLLAPVLGVAAGCAVSAPAGAPPPWLAAALAIAAGLQLMLAERERRVTATPTPNFIEGGPMAAPISPTSMKLGHPGRPGHPGHPGRPGRRPVAAAVALVALGALAGVGLAGARLAAGPPAAAADLVPQPVTPRETSSPLSLFPALRTGRVALELTVHSGQSPARLRYATLTDFDGTYWTGHTRYRRAGTQLPAGPPVTPARAAEDRVHVVTAGRLGWLVSQGRPEHVSVPGLGVDQLTGDVAFPVDRPVPGDYTVRSELPAYTVDDLDGAATAQPANADGALAIPADLATEAQRIAGARYGYQALAALAGHFATDGGFSVESGPRAPAGHGVFQIRQLLRDKVGTAEQYASAFAVLARTLGYDTRVAVGFRTRRAGDGLTVSGKDVDAWPEVRFETLGWVEFAPTPTRAAGTLPAPQPSAQPSSTPSAGGAGTPASDSTVDGATGGAGRPVAVPVPRLVALLGGAIVAALLVLLAIPPLRRGRRRRRHNPTRRAAAAWRDALETLRRARVPVAPADTSGQVAALATGRLGPACGELVAQLAAAHDRVAYAPHRVTLAQADGLWLFADGLRRAVRRQQPLWRRLTGTLHPARTPRGIRAPREVRAAQERISRRAPVAGEPPPVRPGAAPRGSAERSRRRRTPGTATDN
jgi:hypothetical protein